MDRLATSTSANTVVIWTSQILIATCVVGGGCMGWWCYRE